MVFGIFLPNAAPTGMQAACCGKRFVGAFPHERASPGQAAADPSASGNRPTALRANTLGVGEARRNQASENQFERQIRLEGFGSVHRSEKRRGCSMNATPPIERILSLLKNIKNTGPGKWQ